MGSRTAGCEGECRSPSGVWNGDMNSSVQFHKWEIKAHGRAIQPSWQEESSLDPVVGRCAWGQGPGCQEEANLLQVEKSILEV